MWAVKGGLEGSGSWVPLQFSLVPHPTSTGTESWQRFSYGNGPRLPSAFHIKALLADSVWHGLNLWASKAASVPPTPDLFIDIVIYIQ